MSSVRHLARRSARLQDGAGYGASLDERVRSYFVVTNGVVFRYTEMGALFDAARVYVVYDAVSDTTYEEPGYFVEGSEAEGYIANVAPGGVYDNDKLEAAKKRAKTFVAKASGSGGGGGGSETPVIAPPVTVPDGDKKFWQETWFLAMVGTVVAGGVGYGIWRYTRPKVKA